MGPQATQAGARHRRAPRPRRGREPPPGYTRATASAAPEVTEHGSSQNKRSPGRRWRNMEDSARLLKDCDAGGPGRVVCVSGGSLRASLKLCCLGRDAGALYIVPNIVPALLWEPSFGEDWADSAQVGPSFGQVSANFGPTPRNNDPDCSARADAQPGPHRPKTGSRLPKAASSPPTFVRIDDAPDFGPAIQHLHRPPYTAIVIAQGSGVRGGGVWRHAIDGLSAACS